MDQRTWWAFVVAVLLGGCPGDCEDLYCESRFEIRADPADTWFDSAVLFHVEYCLPSSGSSTVDAGSGSTCFVHEYDLDGDFSGFEFKGDPDKVFIRVLDARGEGIVPSMAFRPEYERVEGGCSADCRQGVLILRRPAE